MVAVSYKNVDFDSRLSAQERCQLSLSHEFHIEILIPILINSHEIFNAASIEGSMC